jgi:NTE family protein
VGVAWETGLAAGLEQEGVRLADANLFIGTSAGSIVGAQLAAGRSPAEMLKTQHEIARPERAGEQPPTPSAADMAALMQQFMKLYTSDAPPQQLRAEIGAFALSAPGARSEEEWLEGFRRGEVFAGDQWPARKFVCTAVDAHDGRFVTWDASSGVPLFRAIASSCCVPGIVAPVTIDGRRYIDGGVRSATNADLAKGYDRVLVVSVTMGMETAIPAMAERAKKRLEAELAPIRDAGGQIELIAPNAESRAAFGSNLMDFGRRGPCAEAGARQGRLEAARLRDFWR